MRTAPLDRIQDLSYYSNMIRGAIAKRSGRRRRPTPEVDVCDVAVVHPQEVARVTRAMEDRETLDWAAQILDALSDSTRFRIARALLLSDSLCVCDIANILKMTISAVSHHLRILRAARVVRHRRSGQMVFYRIDDDHVRQIVQTVLAHVRHE